MRPLGPITAFVTRNGGTDAVNAWQQGSDYGMRFIAGAGAAFPRTIDVEGPQANGGRYLVTDAGWLRLSPLVRWRFHSEDTGVNLTDVWTVVLADVGTDVYLPR